MLKYILVLLISATTTMAQLPQYQGGYTPNQSLDEYFAEAYPQYEKSLIFVFYNNDDCYECSQTIEQIEQLYNQYYKGIYDFKVINYQNDSTYNYTATYNLSAPLVIVLARIEDGSPAGYQKIINPQNRISDLNSFNDYLRNRIDDFLGR